MNRESIMDAVVTAVRAHGGKATIVQVAKYIWDNHESDLKASGDLFYLWQYEMRWAAQRLSKAGKLDYARESGRNVWQLVK